MHFLDIKPPLTLKGKGKALIFFRVTTCKFAGEYQAEKKRIKETPVGHGWFKVLQKDSKIS